MMILEVMLMMLRDVVTAMLREAMMLLNVLMMMMMMMIRVMVARTSLGIDHPMDEAEQQDAWDAVEYGEQQEEYGDEAAEEYGDEASEVRCEWAMVLYVPAAARGCGCGRNSRVSQAARRLSAAAGTSVPIPRTRNVVNVSPRRLAEMRAAFDALLNELD
jgi:hypothetical protein